MVSAENVQRLNERIEQINTQKTKTEARIEMLKKQIDSAISEYEKLFGVRLKGKTFAELRKNVDSEYNSVMLAVQSEYELKDKVISAIDSNDYDLAYKLLGQANPNENTNSKEGSGNTGETIETGSPVMLDDEVSGKSANKKPVQTVQQSRKAEAFKPASTPNFSGMGADFGFGMMAEDDDEEEQVIETATAPTGSKTVKTTINHTKQDSAIQGKSVSDTFQNMVMEDDNSSLIEDDFGFGEMLSGSKFTG